MHRILFALPLLAASALAQSAAHPTTQFPVPKASPPTPGIHIVRPTDTCPMGISTQLRGSGSTLWTIALQDANIRAPRADFGVHVQLNSIDQSHIIKSVEVAVRYLPAGLRLLPLSDDIPANARSKTFHLSAQDGAALQLAGDLLIGPSAGILRVNLTRVNFADGTTWQAPTPNACSAKPNGLLLVAAP